jgi:hypothetical protein
MLMVFCLFWYHYLFPSLHDNVKTFYRLQGIQDIALVPVFMSYELFLPLLK